MKDINAYECELKECLKKESLEALDKFIYTHPQMYPKGMVEAWSKADELTKQRTMYILIAKHSTVPNKLKCKARRWLKEHPAKDEDENNETN